MKKQVTLALLAVGIAGANVAFGQRDSRTNDNDRYRRDNVRPNDSRSLNNQSMDDRRYDDRRMNDQRSGSMSGPMDRSMSTQQYERALINAYKEGYRDGMETARQLGRNDGVAPGFSDRNNRDNRDNRSDSNSGGLFGGRNNRSGDNSENRNSVDKREYDRLREELDDVKKENEKLEKKADRYKAFTGGFYAGANTTRFLGENAGGNDLSGRLGYQVGVFTRFGGRIYGQLGAEYFATSSNYFSPGDGQNLENITGRINTQWLQIPVLVGVKLAQSKRGISGVRLGVGAEYANRLGGSNTVNIDDNEIKSGTFLALGNLGFDIGPLLIDLVYHHGLNDAIEGFNNSQRRSFGVNVGFKF
ncbi:porin family protein [Tellurirhabdus rosea]|uniref:hypothetical protein n=1 Tax=Tellurirhabdus rosea TaxID=2674997 RepID=UPI0022573215|nr:hypothetical protein [Tellurirhabdus rosea]